MELCIVISDAGTVKSVEEVATLGELAGWLVVDGVEILVVDAAFDDSFVLIPISVCELGVAKADGLLAFDGYNGAVYYTWYLRYYYLLVMFISFL